MAPELTIAGRALLEAARRATLVTIAPDGRPRPVPCCFVIGSDESRLVIDTPIDGKPKASLEPMRLARVRDIDRDPRVTLLVDRWDEDWSRLAWVRVDGTARILLPASARDARARVAAIEALRARYPPYVHHRLEDLPIIRIVPTAITGWAASGMALSGVS